MSPMVHADLDPGSNLLRVSYEGDVSMEEIRSLTERIRALLVNSKPGLKLLSDLSELKSMDISTAEEIGCAMELLTQARVEVVIRVIPDPTKDIGFNILGIFHYGPTVRMVETTSMEQAEGLLRQEASPI